MTSQLRFKQPERASGTARSPRMTQCHGVRIAQFACIEFLHAGATESGQTIPAARNSSSRDDIYKYTPAENPSTPDFPQNAAAQASGKHPPVGNGEHRRVPVHQTIHLRSSADVRDRLKSQSRLMGSRADHCPQPLSLRNFCSVYGTTYCTAEGSIPRDQSHRSGSSHISDVSASDQL